MMAISTTFFAKQLKSDPYTQAIKASNYKQYMIGMSVDDGDQMYGFGKGPDFGGGYNNAHLGWIVLTMSPLQTANPNKGFVYPDTVVYSKRALRDQLAAKYKTIAALNAAWGSQYTTFDSSGVAVTGETIGTGNGSQVEFHSQAEQTRPDTHVGADQTGWRRRGGRPGTKCSRAGMGTECFWQHRLRQRGDPTQVCRGSRSGQRRAPHRRLCRERLGHRQRTHG